MKEILYIQAGSLANYTGTHFWNTQASYYEYNNGDPSQNISFVERLTGKNETTLFPRLLAFDYKANFGALTQHASDSTDVQDLTRHSELWDGDILRSEQENIDRSEYHEQMDNDTEDQGIRESSIRFWSDFSRVYYMPRTIQKLHDTEEPGADWIEGSKTFARFDQEAALMEGSLRQFVEECDSLQGIQVINDVSTFGTFSHSFLTAFRDDFPKLANLVFPILSDSDPDTARLVDRKSLSEALHDTFCLRNLNEIASICIPIQPVSAWKSKAWDDELKINFGSLYQSSAILSTHIESATLPMRDMGVCDDLGSFCSQLNWRGSTRFAELSGLFPLTTDAGLERPFFDFSLSRLYNPFIDGSHVKTWFVRRDISRGLHPSTRQIYSEWYLKCPLRPPLFSSYHFSACPLPSSFPHFFKASSLTIGASSMTDTLYSRPSANMISSVTASSEMATLFARYAKLADRCRSGLLGVEKDDVVELANDLWTIHDTYVEV